MSVQELTQDTRFFTDNPYDLLTTQVKMREPRREMHWPNLALGDAYPVTDQDGKILRHASMVSVPAECAHGNMDLL